MACLETAGTVTVDGVPFSLRPGHSLLVFPQSYHHFSHLAERSLLWLMVTFETTEPERLAVLRQRTLQMERADLESLSQLVSRFSGGGQRGRGDALSIGLSGLLCRLCERAGQEEPVRQGLSPRRLTGLRDRLQAQLLEAWHALQRTC